MNKKKKEVSSRSVGQQSEKSAFWQAVGLVFQFGYTIALPLVVLALAGRFLDKKFNSSPILFLVTIVLSLIISSVALLIKIKKIMGEIE